MSNLTAEAFPIFEPGGTDGSISKGLTKHEYAAIKMAQGLLANYEYLPNADERKQIADTAYDLAEAVLSYFNNPK